MTPLLYRYRNMGFKEEMIMDLLPLAMIQASRATDLLMNSALPDASVLAHRERRQHAVRTRAATARGLEWLAQAVAPKASSSCSPAH